MKDGTIKGGYVSQIVYEGSWISDKSSQNSFLYSNKGRVLAMVGVLTTNKARCIFQIYQSTHIDSPLLEAYLDIDLENNKQSIFTGTAEVDLVHKSSLFGSLKKTKCTLELTFDLKNKKDQSPISISSNDIKDAMLQGKVSSSDCEVDFTFDSTPSSVKLISVLIFVFLEILVIIIGIAPLYKMLRGGNMTDILVLSKWMFLMNIMIDVIFIVINLTLSLKVLVQYFEFLTVITMFLMFSILFKIRFYLYADQIRFTRLNLSPQMMTRRKIISALKFVVIGIVCVVLANLMIVHEFIFLIFFAYPVIQIFFNFSGVTQKNCFLIKLHLPLILPQIIYPIFLKGLPFSFFNLTPKTYFPIVLSLEVMGFLAILFLQKCFGACFFLPKFLIPNYFNYFKKFKSHPISDDENCPICFSSLMEFPDDDNEDDQTQCEEKESPLLPSKYMQTPCKHKFHEDCLKNWLEQKLICPCCRTTIPPII